MCVRVHAAKEEMRTELHQTWHLLGETLRNRAAGLGDRVCREGGVGRLAVSLQALAMQGSGGWGGGGSGGRGGSTYDSRA